MADATHDSGHATEADQHPNARTAGVIGPDGVRVREDEFHRLHVIVDGTEHSNVRAVRAFPISEKADYISFLDSEGHEVALMAEPDKLDEASRVVLARALKTMYYMPKITCVHSITEKMGVGHWEVTTDRGYASFEVVSREQIRRLPRGRLLLNDADGNRFEIEDTEALDVRSRALIHSET